MGSLAGAQTVGDVVAILEHAYPPSLAADWDAIGLTCGDPADTVSRVLLAVDCTEATVREAIEIGAQLFVTHHPLLFAAVHSVAATDAKGRMVHALVRSGIAHLAVHTNADHADPGVSDALAAALGILVEGPIDPTCPGAETGTGRIGRLPRPLPLADFAEQVAAALPATAHGVRVAGDLDRRVARVAVCGGAGDALLALLPSGIDAYVTADLRHHRAQEHLEDGGCALVDIAHWASEWPWLEQAAAVLRERTTLEVVVSRIPTDPWSTQVPSTPGSSR